MHIRRTLEALLYKPVLELKKQYNNWLDTLLSKIHNLELTNKSDPNPARSSTLTKLRLEGLLYDQHDKFVHNLKIQHYASDNRIVTYSLVEKKKHVHLVQPIKGRISQGDCWQTGLKFKRPKPKLPILDYPHTKQKIHNPQEIGNSFADYFSSLYNLKQGIYTLQPSAHDIDSIRSCKRAIKLSEEQLSILNAPFRTSEIIKIIDSLPNGCPKASGQDSFSNDYYKMFNTIISPYLIEMYKAAASTATFPPEMLKAYIVTDNTQTRERPINSHKL